MKKWYFILIAAVLPLLATTFASCDDDDKDLPDVNISLDVTKGTVADGVIYVAQGDTIKIAGINVVNNEAGKGAGVTNVNYYWDGVFYAPSIFSPFGMVFPTTEETPLGDHSIDISCTVLAVDKTLASAALTYPVKVVASPEDIPTNATPATIVKSTTLKQ